MKLRISFRFPRANANPNPRTGIALGTRLDYKHIYCCCRASARQHTILDVLRILQSSLDPVSCADLCIVEKSIRVGWILGSPNICVYKIPLNKIHYKIHFNNSSSCIFCFYIVHLSKLVPRLHCLHAAVFVTCDVFILNI